MLPVVNQVNYLGPRYRRKEREISPVSKPVNTALTAAAVADRVPGDARQVQARWDSVINARAALQTLGSPHCASRSPWLDPHSAVTTR
jgi:hypothetical protein